MFKNTGEINIDKEKNKVYAVRGMEGENIKFYRGKTYFVPLGGSSEIGRNLNVLGYDNKWIIMDLGVSFSKEMGIDITMPDISFLDNKNVVAIIITHGHEDHIGAIPYLIDHINAPIYATKFTAELIIEKIKDEQKLFGQQVDVRVVNQGDKFIIEDTFQVEFIAVTHSILESSMVHIKTPTVSLINTGDWKFDHDPGTGVPSDLVRLAEIGREGVDFLLCDSTNVVTERSAGSEMEVAASLEKVVCQYPSKRIILTGFASNIARLKSCVLAAKKYGRKLFIEGRSLKRMVSIAQRNGYLSSDDVSTAPYDNFPLEKTFLVCTGCQGEASAVLRRLTKANKIHRGRDLVIFSSRAIPCNTQDITDLKNMIISQGGDVLCSSDPTFFEEKEERTPGTHQFKGAFFSVKDLKLHVSGHASSEEIYHLLTLVRPNYLIPAYGDAYHMYYMHKLAKSVNQKYHESCNGSIFLLEQEGIKLLGKIHVPVMGIDGNNIVSLEASHILQRKKMSMDGVVCLSIAPRINTAAHLNNMRLTVLGVAYTQDVLREINISVKEFLLRVGIQSGGSMDLAVINEFIQGIFLEKTVKNPVVVVHQ